MVGTGADPTRRRLLRPCAPQLTVPQEKIGIVIGPGGRNVRAIQEATGAEVQVRWGEGESVVALHNQPSQPAFRSSEHATPSAHPDMPPKTAATRQPEPAATRHPIPSGHRWTATPAPS